MTQGPDAYNGAIGDPWQQAIAQSQQQSQPGSAPPPYASNEPTQAVDYGAAGAEPTQPVGYWQAAAEQGQAPEPTVSYEPPGSAPHPFPYGAPPPAAPDGAVAYNAPPASGPVFNPTSAVDSSMPPPPAWDPAPTQAAMPYGYPAYGAPVGAVTHPQATTALVLGVLGFIGGFTCVIGFFLSPFAWVIGSRAEANIRANPHQFSGLGMATVGKILGIIGTVVLVLGLLALGGLIAYVVYDMQQEPDPFGANALGLR